MSRVYYEPENDMWIHADTGNRIRAWDVRNTEPHRSEIERRGGGAGHLRTAYSDRIAGDVTEPGTVDQHYGQAPIPPTNPKAEEEYVEEILAVSTYA